MYHFDEALKWYHSDFEHNLHKKITTNNNNENETTFYDDGSSYEVSPMVDASTHYAQKIICLETLKVDDAQQSEEPFEV